MKRGGTGKGGKGERKEGKDGPLTFLDCGCTYTLGPSDDSEIFPYPVSLPELWQYWRTSNIYVDNVICTWFCYLQNRRHSNVKVPWVSSGVRVAQKK